MGYAHIGLSLAEQARIDRTMVGICQAIVASVAPIAQDRPQARRAARRIGGPALAGIARLVAAWLDCGRIGPMGEAVGRVSGSVRPGPRETS